MNDYNYVVIGSGPSLFRFLPGMQESNSKILVVEANDFGGICPNAGCEPKIFFEGASKISLISQKLVGKGIDNRAKINWTQLVQEKKRVFAPVPQNMQQLFEQQANTIHGTATFIDNHTIKVNNKLITSDHFVIATGLKPRALDITGKQYLLTSNDVFNMEELPESVAIIGGGYIAMEIASLLSVAGAHVTILLRSDRPLRAFDSRHVKKVVNEMKESLGIDFQYDTEASEIQNNNAKFQVTTKDGRNLEFDKVVNASGRVPNIDSLHLENTDVTVDNQGIVVDEHLQTTASNIYAMGDVIKKAVPALTSIAQFEGEYLSSYLQGNKSKGIQHPVVGTVAFTFPQIAQAGVNIDQARQDSTLRVKDVEIAQGDYVYTGTADYNAHLSLVYDQQNHIVGASEVSQTAVDDINALIPVIALDVDPKVWQEKMTLIFPSLAYKLRSLV